MSRGWTFRDYVEPSGENVIHAWLHALPLAACARINVTIEYLQGTPILGMPYVKKLKGPCEGLFEIRVIVNNIQYRPLGWYGPGDRDATLLIGAIERGGRFEPLSVCSTALMRKPRIAEQGRTCEHDFS